MPKLRSSNTTRLHQSKSALTLSWQPTLNSFGRRIGSTNPVPVGHSTTNPGSVVAVIFNDRDDDDNVAACYDLPCRSASV